MPPRTRQSLLGKQFPNSPEGAIHWVRPIGAIVNIGRTAKSNKRIIEKFFNQSFIIINNFTAIIFLKSLFMNNDATQF